MRIVIQKNVLQAMSNLSGKKDVRYYLNGVCVIANDQMVRYVATDGHIMGIYQHERNAEHDNGLGSLIVPNEVIAKLEKNVDLILEQINGQWVVGSQLFTPIDGKFPDYQRVLPRGEVSNEVAQFNPDFIVRFQKVGKLLVKNAVPTIGHNGSGSALVDIGHMNFIGVMMPIRTEKPLPKVPLAFLDNVSV